MPSERSRIGSEEAASWGNKSNKWTKSSISQDSRPAPDVSRRQSRAELPTSHRGNSGHSMGSPSVVPRTETWTWLLSSDVNCVVFIKNFLPALYTNFSRVGDSFSLAQRDPVPKSKRLLINFKIIRVSVRITPSILFIFSNINSLSSSIELVKNSK